MRKLNKLLMAAMLLVFPLAACDEGDDTVAPPEPAVGTVSGTVSVEGTGLAGVTVSLAGASAQSTTTGANGTYSFTNVVEGNYSVTLSAVPGDVVFSQTTQSVSITTDGQTSTADFNGQYVRTASILVSVTRGSGEGVATTVRVQGVDVDQSLGTNANGQVQFTGLRAGTYTVTLTNPPEGFDITEQTVQLNTGQSAQVNFTGERELREPDVVIESITSATLGTPVDPDSLMGRVEITVDVRPHGNALESIELLVRDLDTGELYRIGRQTFSVGAPQLQGEGDIDVVFSWNTDGIRRVDGSHPSVRIFDDGEFVAIEADAMRPYHPVFLNGEWEIIARVTVVEFEDPFNAMVEVITINEDAINLGVFSDNTDWVDPVSGEHFPNFLIRGATGLRWLSGDIHITAYPIIYSAPFDPNNPLLQRAAFMFDGFVGGADAGFGGAELTAPNNPDNTFTFVFCETPGAPPAPSTDGRPCYSNIFGLNTGTLGARNINLVTKTTFGQHGPGIANIKSVILFDTDLQSGTGVLNDVLRIDIEGPNPGVMDPSNLPHPANAYIGVAGFSRTGIGGANNLGWVNWDDNLTGLVDDPSAATGDNVFVYPLVDKNGAAWPVGSPMAALAGTTLFGIGMPAGVPNLLYIHGPDSGLGTVAAIIAAADIVALEIFGRDLPPETDSPGLIDAGSAEGTPFSDTELDYTMTARHWDLFGNRRNAANFIWLGVDGRAPIYSNAAGTTDPNAGLALVDPTTAGSVYNTYDDDFYDLDLRAVASAATFGNSVWNSTTTGVAPFHLGKSKGAYSGFTTDRGNGFSGVAGVVVHDWENRCASGTLACAGSPMSARWGFTLQPVGISTSVVMPFVFDGQTDLSPAGGDTFSDVLEPGRVAVHAVGVPFRAYVATQDVNGPHDGYREHTMETWDRAGNAHKDMNASEGNADHDGPDVGNVQMPTVVTFNLAQNYTFAGENADNVDLKGTDFSFDFNSILSLQVYSSPSALSHPNHVVGSQVPPNDVAGVTFEETSLQLPLMNVPHTAFGSQDIYRGGNLSITTEFLGCLVRADEYGVATAGNESANTIGDVDPVAEPRVHIPRGPRWRTWDHSSEYGLVNTQFNTFVQTSIPTCLTPIQIASNFVPALGQVGPGFDGIPGTADDGSGPDGIFGTQDDDASWIFNLTSSGAPRITFKGATGNFVPNIDPNQDVLVYYLDTSGRARLVDNSNFSLIVSDLGAGAFGRWYEYTLTNPLPGDLIDTSNMPTNGTVGGWFFVVRGSGVNGNAGHGVIWDGTSNPDGVVAFDALATDGTVSATPGGSGGIFQFMTTANTAYLVQTNAALDHELRVNPIMGDVTVADTEFIGLSEHEFIGFVAPGAMAVSAFTDANPGEINAQVCVLSQATAGGASVVLTLDDTTDCIVQPGPGAALAAGEQWTAQMVQVTLAAGVTYTFDLTTNGVAGTDLQDPAMILLSPNGLPVISRNANSNVGNANETMDYTVPADAGGTYVLIVHAGASVAGDDGAVTLTVSN